MSLPVVMRTLFLQHPTASIGYITVLSLALLTGCQQQIQTTAPISNMPSSTGQIQAPKRFAITGKIGVRTPKQNGSAFYAWAQEDQRFAIDLSGALGIGQTHIEGIAGKVSLDSSKTGHIEAETPEILLEYATGWQAPISHLSKWIVGVTAGQAETETRDTHGRLATLREDGWDVVFSYADTQAIRPEKLSMTQAITGGENRVILTIQTRTESP